MVKYKNASYIYQSNIGVLTNFQDVLMLRFEFKN